MIFTCDRLCGATINVDNLYSSSARIAYIAHVPRGALQANGLFDQTYGWTHERIVILLPGLFGRNIRVAPGVM